MVRGTSFRFLGPSVASPSSRIRSRPPVSPCGAGASRSCRVTSHRRRALQDEPRCGPSISGKSNGSACASSQRRKPCGKLCESVENARRGLSKLGDVLQSVKIRFDLSIHILDVRQKSADGGRTVQRLQGDKAQFPECLVRLSKSRAQLIVTGRLRRGQSSVFSEGRLLYGLDIHLEVELQG